MSSPLLSPYPARLTDSAAAYLSMPQTHQLSQSYEHYLQFPRESWRQLRADTPLQLTEAELQNLRGQNESVSMQEVADIYLPLSRLINLYVIASLELYRVTSTFLSQKSRRVPYIIGMAGSVAVGKSTTARILRTLLSRWPQHPRVDLLPTDGYLYPNEELRRRGMMLRKGFPESYRLEELLDLLRQLKAGKRQLKTPVYSHRTYDLTPDTYHELDQPDIIIVEGLNVLQSSQDAHSKRHPQVFVSDFFDFTIYVDAPTELIENWYVARFLTHCEEALHNPDLFFHRFASLSTADRTRHALQTWRDINHHNLLENILPTRERAQLILQKGADHSIEQVYLRKR